MYNERLVLRAFKIVEVKKDYVVLETGDIVEYSKSRIPFRNFQIGRYYVVPGGINEWVIDSSVFHDTFIQCDFEKGVKSGDMLDLTGSPLDGITHRVPVYRFRETPKSAKIARMSNGDFHLADINDMLIDGIVPYRDVQLPVSMTGHNWIINIGDRYYPMDQCTFRMAFHAPTDEELEKGTCCNICRAPGESGPVGAAYENDLSMA